MNNTSRLQQLPLKYSSIFGQQEPYRMYIRVGWYEIVDDLFELLTVQVATEPYATLRITTVKEKFGLLRVNYKLTDGSPRLSEMIRQAVNAASEHSRYLCELCGARGTLYQGPCWRVRCEHCLETR